MEKLDQKPAGLIRNNVSAVEEDGLTYPEHFDFIFNQGPDISFDEHYHHEGGEAHIDRVCIKSVFRNAPFQCVRRSYKAGRHNLQKAKKDQAREIDILKKVRNEIHFIQLVGSYTNEKEVVLLQNPWADCDLGSLLGKSIDERRAIIADHDLERGIGCLASALYFLHSIRIRHKDIAPGNILVHGTNLLYADFGLSMDFSTSNNSETSNYIRQQSAYRAPEGHNGMKHTCASDVFSLGCVFLQMLASLYARQEAGPVNHHCLQRPYRDHLVSVQYWLEDKKGIISAGGRPEAAPSRMFWLRKTQQMLARHPSDRPRMTDVVSQLKAGIQSNAKGFASSACGDCLEKRIKALNLDAIAAPMNMDYDDQADVHVLLGHDPPQASSTRSTNQASSNVSWYGQWVVPALRGLGLIQRWHLTFHLDHGRSLRMYGTQASAPDGITMSFDFGDLVVVRVVFEAGTFGKTVTLYQDRTRPTKHCFKKSGPFDQNVPEGFRVWKYGISSD